MNWYEDDVNTVLKERAKCLYNPETIFYGSSSFTLWKTIYEDFEPFKPVNLAFGGSTLAACTWFFDKIVAPVTNPKRLILYAGDNDLGDGRRPEEVFIFYHEFETKLKARYGDLPFFFISVKPSLKREEILKEIITTNELIKSHINKKQGNEHFVDIYNHMIDSSGKPLKKYFEPDGLHLNAMGYELWREVIGKALVQTGNV